MEIAKIGTAQTAIDAASGSPTLREATQQFESLFISQLMKSMRDTVPQSQLLSAGTGQQLFREMLDQEIAGRVSQSGGIGIGEMLFQQLSPAQTVRTKQATGAETAALAPASEPAARRHPAIQTQRSQNHED